MKKGRWRFSGLLWVAVFGSCQSSNGSAADAAFETNDSRADPTDIVDAIRPHADLSADNVAPAEASAIDKRAPQDLLPEVSGADAHAERDTAEVMTATEWNPPPPYCVESLCSAGPEAAPDPSIAGPYEVGIRTETLETVDHAGEVRHLKVDIWYPGRPGTGAVQPFAYDLVADAPPEVAERFAGYTLDTFPVDAHRDMDVFSEYGPYPLVIFSHGAYGIRYQSVFFTIPLASHGYVVVAPDHEGNTLYDLFLEGYTGEAVAASALDRIGDGRFLIDHYLERGTTLGDDFAGIIDPARIGFCGHSFGGFLTLYMGGKDARVKAALPFAPATSMLAALQVPAQYYPIPFMMQGGLLDQTLKYDREMLPFYSHGATPKYLVELARGGHFTYSDICRLDLAAIATDLGYEEATNALDDGCAAENIPYEQAHVIIRRYGIAFFNQYLRKSAGSAQYLDPATTAVFGSEVHVERQL